MVFYEEHFCYLGLRKVQSNLGFRYNVLVTVYKEEGDKKSVVYKHLNTKH